jgi:tetratricopeptide (TPR) repeat protein
MKIMLKFKSFYFVVALVLSSFVIDAQSLEEAQVAYNAGVTANGEGNVEEAINQFESCITISQALVDAEEDETAEQLLSTVQAVVPGLYMKLGSTQISAGEVETGLASLYTAKDLAVQYGDSDTEEKVLNAIPQIHYKNAAGKYKAGKLDEAIAELDKALAISPDFVSAYYLKAVVYKKQNNGALLKATADKGIEAATAANDEKNKDKIIKLAKGYFLKKGNEAKKASNNEEAISNLIIALEYAPTDATALYLLSSTYLANGNYDEAIEAGDKAIANEAGDDEAKAKIYMVIAEAQTKSGDTGAACTSYKKAAVGQYTELATYKIEQELKCE